MKERQIKRRKGEGVEKRKIGKEREKQREGMGGKEGEMLSP